MASRSIATARRQRIVALLEKLDNEVSLSLVMQRKSNYQHRRTIYYRATQQVSPCVDSLPPSYLQALCSVMIVQAIKRCSTLSKMLHLAVDATSSSQMSPRWVSSLCMPPNPFASQVR
jgi:hypothetical protein